MPCQQHTCLVACPMDPRFREDDGGVVVSGAEDDGGGVVGGGESGGGGVVSDGER